MRLNRLSLSSDNNLTTINIVNKTASQNWDAVVAYFECSKIRLSSNGDVQNEMLQYDCVSNCCDMF